MKLISEPFDGVKVLQPQKFEDKRGFFIENYHISRYRELGVHETFVQDNHSRSHKGILRGLHFRKKMPQAQIVTVMNGRIFDVVVDIRLGSKTFGQWFGIELDVDGPNQIYMAAGFAHGFCVLSNTADLHYKVNQEYASDDECGLQWKDPVVGVEWPIKAPVVSERDQKHPFWEDLF